jgi:hypothetical protein
VAKVHPEQEGVPPSSVANVTPDISATVGQTRLIAKEVVQAVEVAVVELKADVREIKGHRITDLFWHIGAFTGIFILLAGAMIAAYLKLEDKISTLSTAATRIETKLDDLIARIPPIQTQPPQRTR